jgi:hypothetical protein
MHSADTRVRLTSIVDARFSKNTREFYIKELLILAV